MRIFDTDAVGTGTLPEADTITSEAAHHGVALELADGSILSTIGTAEARSGVRHLAADGTELARNEQCPSVHGEGALKGEVVMFGCEDGVLLFDAGRVHQDRRPPTSSVAPANAYVSDTSAIAFGDYKTDPDQEGYLLSQLARIDTGDADDVDRRTSPKVWITPGAESGATDTTTSWCSGRRQPVAARRVRRARRHLGCDRSVESPTEWQQPHPGLHVVGDIAYVTEPAKDRILAVDLHTGEVSAEATLDVVPNEFVVVGAAGH